MSKTMVTDRITRLNCTLATYNLDLAVFLQRTYMKLSILINPIRQFETSFGAIMRGSVSDYILRRICFFGFFEPSLTRFMMHQIKPSQIVVDVGANVGYFTLLMSKLVGTGSVIAIEASPSTFELLQWNLQRNKADNVRAMEIAVADRRGDFLLTEAFPMNTGSRQIVDVSEGSEGVPVSADTLMALIGEEVDRVSFVKIDIEGAERAPLLEILENKERFAKPLTGVSEISQRNRDLIDMFQSSGFKVGILPNDYTWAGYLKSGVFDGRVLSLHGQERVTDDFVLTLD